MYPEELKRYIEERNSYLGGDELEKATSVKENPQLNHIKYNPFDKSIEEWDEYGNHYKIYVMPYEEYEKAKSKQLVKK